MIGRKPSLALYAAALLPRLAFVLWAPGEPAADGQFYHAYGEHIARGWGYIDVDGSPVVRWMPGWPLLLGGLYALFGSGTRVALLANAGLDAATVEDTTVAIVREIRDRVDRPISVKLSPFYTSLANVARRLHDEGADGLVLFNRFFEPDLDVEELAVTPHLAPSGSAELLLRLRWLAIVSGAIPIGLAVSGGVHRSIDAVKAIMCGASAVQVVSSTLIHGPARLATLRDGLSEWLAEHGYESVRQMRGSMDLARCPEPRELTRAHYVRLLQTWDGTAGS